jgi:hypothetical protein
MDEVRIYNYPRTSQQIVEDMNAAHPTGGSPIGSYTSYWKMDEGYSTTAHDYNATNGNDLTLSSSSWNQTGKVNRAWNGTGSVWLTRSDDNDFDFSASDDFSLSMWFKSDSTTNPTNNEYLFTKGTITNTGTAGYAVYADSSGKINFGVKDDTAWGASSPNTITPDDTATSTADIYDNTWHHIVAQKVGTTGIYLYVDGKLNASDTSIAATATLANSIALFVGDDDGDSANSFNGDLDEVKIYRSALTQEQVNMDYNAGSGLNFGVGASLESSTLTDGTGTAPVAYWKLDDKSGSSAVDSSGTGNTATLTNSPTWVSGKYGGGLKMVSGSSQDLNLGASNTLLTDSNNWTVSFWAKRTTASATVSADEFLLSLRGPPGRAVGVNYRQATSTLNFEYRDNASAFHRFSLGTLTSISDKWQHIEVTYNGTTFYAYLNGVLTASSTDTFIGFSSTAARIGSDAGSTPASATFDQVVFYGYARTPAQVAYDYNRGGPQGYWKFNECSGTTANDSSGTGTSGTGNTGTITIGASGTSSVGTCATSATAWGNGATGKYNASLSYDGTDDYTDLGDLSYTESASQLTWSFWVKPTALATTTAIIAKANLGSNPGVNSTQVSWAAGTLSSDSNDIDCIISTSTTDLGTAGYTTSDVLANGTWAHVVCVFDGTASGNSNRLKMYVNGKQVTLSFVGTIPASTQATTSNARVGSASDSRGFFNGLVDDVRIYNYALSATQVKRLYDNDSTAFFGPSTGSP